jgi:exodeoxyribonuclease VII small subunit
VIEKLESSSTSLDEMVQLYEEGIKLTHSCKSKLAAAEERITTLVNEKDELKEVPGI